MPAKAGTWRGSASQGRFPIGAQRRRLAREAGRMNSTAKGLRPVAGLRRPGEEFRAGEGRHLARKRLPGPISNRRTAPTSGARGRSKEFDRKGLWPVAGLRRPGEEFRAGEGRHLVRQRLPGPISNRRTAPAPGARGGSNEFDLKGPSASGRPAPAGVSRRRRPTLGAKHPGRPISNRRDGPMAGLRRPECFLRRWRPTCGAERLGEPISIGAMSREPQFLTISSPPHRLKTYLPW